jgi:2-polyprenyl-6-methoxyphenol hydroxylase-like FAD-dependent oxidoreductase
LSYTSCVVRPRVTSRHDFRMLLIPPVMPRCPRGGLWVPLEQGRYLATLITYEKDRPPLDWKGFRAWAVGVDDPLLARVLDDCEPLSEPQRFAISKRVFRRYDRFAGRPKRLIALGDAMCSFDPAFGQGMSVCALEARALERLLADRELSVDELVARYFTQAAALIATPWSMSRAHPAPLQTRRRCGPREAILARLPARVFESSGSVADAAPRLRARRESRGASEQPACTRPRASSAAPSRPARVAAKCSGARRRL